MNLLFNKFHGTGNDFILLDIRENDPQLSTERIRFLCDRRFGIGADGLITLGKDASFSFFMRYYNSDGKESTMCGNGGRCIAFFAYRLNLGREEMTFNAIDGNHKALLFDTSENTAIVRLKMKDVSDVINNPGHSTLNTGSPHYVTFCKGVERLDIREEGRKIRYSDPFLTEGINVDFAEKKDEGLFVRTYERGVEDETLSCGTGVTASVLAAATLDEGIISPVRVLTLGGNLLVYFQRKGNGFTDVWLEGPTMYVFSGTIEL